MGVHAPVVAGTFYPADADALSRMVDQLIADAPAIGAPKAKAVVMPHAGYRFSGAPAAAAAAALEPGPSRVVVLGPSHRHAFRGVALPDAQAMATPLGEIPLDAEAMAALLAMPDVNVVPEAFAAEHSIEVELPFLQRRLGAFRLVPLVVGEIADERLAEILETLWGGDETLVVVSTDLTHFLTAADAEMIDAGTAAFVETLRPDRIGAREACGHRPLSAFLRCADRRGMRLTRAALTHSGAVTGDQSRVVGYGAWVAHDPDRARLSPEHRASALRVARQALESRARRGRTPALHLPSFPAPLCGIAASFVTLTIGERLRGCIGSLQAHRPLAEDVLENTVKAGFQDPRFGPVGEDEAAACRIEIAVLSRAAPMTFDDEQDLMAQIRPGIDGLILQSGARRGTFLPKVWDSLPTAEAFLSGLKVKAGLPRDHWSGDLKVWRYVAESFAEPSPAGQQD